MTTNHRYFIAAGHIKGTGARGNGLEEGAVAIRVAHALRDELARVKQPVILVPDSLDLGATIHYINEHADKPTDRAIELHMNAANRDAHGSMVAVTLTSRVWATHFIHELATIGIEKWSKGVYSEAEVAGWHGWDHLGFCHETRCSAALLEMGFITNSYDAKHFVTDLGVKQVARALAKALHY